MFGISDKILVSDLKVQIEDLKKENERLVYANKVYKDRLEGELVSAKFAVDWKAMNAFSVERGWCDGTLRTTIGYMLQEPVVITEGSVTTKDVVREWVLYCSAEEHDHLVAEFKEYRDSK